MNEDAIRRAVCLPDAPRLIGVFGLPLRALLARSVRHIFPRFVAVVEHDAVFDDYPFNY